MEVIYNKTTKAPKKITKLTTLYSRRESQITMELSSGDHSMPAKSIVSTANVPIISHV